MIDAKRLLADLQVLRADLEDDLRERCDEHPDLEAPLREEYQRAFEAGRTGDAYTVWKDDRLTQVAVAWILGGVFVRFLEDNRLIDPPRLSGPGERRQRALDEHTQYFRNHPEENDRDYLLHVFHDVADLPAAGAVVDPRHNPLCTLGPSGDGAERLLKLWQRIDPDTGTLQHDFTDANWDTRFLGDLYQDLSEAARKRYALLQTPEFVEEFILDRTLMPAIEEFGAREVRLIDPACGSGHFLLGAFHRLDAIRAREEPGTNPRDRTRQVVEQLVGVDLNPYAAAITRFRLLLAALRSSGVERLADAPAFEIKALTGDSLLHGKRPNPAPGEAVAASEYGYRTEDVEALRKVLGRQYHVVVANPPYITPKDSGLNQAYRSRFASCHRQYSLAVPFTECAFDLAILSPPGLTQPAGFVGMITANSFMKREFGKKLIEEFIPCWDLTHIIDTSGLPVEEHGTSTVLLFGRHRPPSNSTLRALLSIRGEPKASEGGSKGLVWSAILSQVDRAGSESEFISSSDVPRERFAKHPWSIGGGGAIELKDCIESKAVSELHQHVASIGRTAHTGADGAYVSDARALSRRGLPDDQTAIFVEGDMLRDWALGSTAQVVFPYSVDLRQVSDDLNVPALRYLWPFRAMLWERREPGGTHREIGFSWYQFSRFHPERFQGSGIAFAFVATHNHFVLDRGGKVFKQSAPVIKLPAGASEDDQLGLLGLLNSSTACFWMKQVFYCKGAGGVNEGAKEEVWERFFEFDSTKLRHFPVPQLQDSRCSRLLDAKAAELRQIWKRILGSRWLGSAALDAAFDEAVRIREEMISLQEELDWYCYQAYGLTDEVLVFAPDDVPSIRLGERAFEIKLARRCRAGETNTAWFERHGSSQITEPPKRWPAEYRELVQRRIEEIERNRNLALIEQPEYKRRWNDEPWEGQQERALRTWLLDRLEAPPLWAEVRLGSVARLSDRLRSDTEFTQAAELYTGRSDFDLGNLVAELVAEESVPLVSTLRYKPSGLRKRAVWEETWELQRREDAIDARVTLPETHRDHLTADEAQALKASQVGTIPVPPKYTSADFQRASYWRLRGKLDVPKERFVSLPFCERETDASLVIGWAGWSALEQSRAVAAYYVQMKEQEGWTAERLTPLLAAVAELLPWVRQWHDEVDPELGMGMGTYFEGFIDEEARSLGLTPDAICSWVPPRRRKATRARRKRTAST